MGKIVAKTAHVASTVASSAAGGAVTKMTDNALNDKELLKDVKKEAIIGGMTGVISGAVTKVPTIKNNSIPIKEVKNTTYGFLNDISEQLAKQTKDTSKVTTALSNTMRSLVNGVRDKILDKGSKEIYETIENNK